MRVRHSTRPLPRNWKHFSKRYGIVGELDIKVRHTSRLWMKALMFKSVTGMREFWRKALQNGELGRYCRGVVNGLAVEHVRFHKGGGETRTMEVDPRYFCIMGLIAGHTTMEIVCHEAVHAAFNYAKRVNKRDLWHGAKDLDEENVCYPAGRIAATLGEWIRRRGYDQKLPFSRAAKRPLARKTVRA